MPTRERTDAAFAFLTTYVKRHPSATYQDAADAASAAGHRVFPIQFTRAVSAVSGPKPAPKKRVAAPKPPRRAALKATLVVRNAKDLATWSEIVSRINVGARAEIKGNGERWQIVVR
ncbi:MAG: hypothetical protein JNL94_03470 [Planctomycetes bacterium]|nr:hypothetical protein [Planctomycetota bacterium]